MTKKYAVRIKENQMFCCECCQQKAEGVDSGEGSMCMLYCYAGRPLCLKGQDRKLGVYSFSIPRLLPPRWRPNVDRHGDETRYTNHYVPRVLELYSLCLAFTSVDIRHSRKNTFLGSMG